MSVKSGSQDSMTSKGKIPDAWDDNWENQADKTSQSTEDLIESLPKLSKAERRAKQAELNKRLWEEAEAPRNNFYLETRNAVPLQTEMKPAVKVLSRKPAPTVISRKDPTTGIEKLTVDDDDDDDGVSDPQPMSLEERQAKAKKEREEKQRKYEEARERLFGSPAQQSGSGSKTPPRATPSPSRASSDRGKVRGRGGGSRSTSSNGSKQRHLYEPNLVPRSDSSHAQRQDNVTPIQNAKSVEDDQIKRQPRGPDGTGRGGHGFTRSHLPP